MTDYEKQAQEFLTKTETTFKAVFNRQGKYFDDDKEERDIYDVTLTRGSRSYTFSFGQSIQSSGEIPSAYDVLACITKYDPGTFENFCGDFGYDTDSRKAEVTYKAVIAEYTNLLVLYNDDELELMAEIQ